MYVRKLVNKVMQVNKYVPWYHVKYEFMQFAIFNDMLGYLIHDIRNDLCKQVSHANVWYPMFMYE